MSKSRREFFTEAALAVLAVSVPGPAQEQKPDAPPGAPPAFGTAQPVGPEVSSASIAQAEKLVQVSLTEAERAQAAFSWRVSLAPVYERRTGPLKVPLESGLAPYSQWNPILPDQKTLPARDQFIRSNTDPGPLPTHDEDVAFASLARHSRWIEQRKLTSEPITNLFRDMLEKYNTTLRSPITVIRKPALDLAKRAD